MTQLLLPELNSPQDNILFQSPVRLQTHHIEWFQPPCFKMDDCCIALTKTYTFVLQNEHRIPDFKLYPLHSFYCKAALICVLGLPLRTPLSTVVWRELFSFIWQQDLSSSDYTHDALTSPLFNTEPSAPSCFSPPIPPSPEHQHSSPILPLVHEPLSLNLRILGTPARLPARMPTSNQR